jgi:hypothetical protein
MKALPPRFRDDSSSRIGTYEAFLDLLTLFCFILMFAAAIYVANPAPPGSTELLAQDAARGATPGVLPNSQVELKIAREGTINRLTVLDGSANRTLNFEVTDSNIGSTLASIQSSLQIASNVSIAVFEDSQPVDAEIVVAIQRWMSYNNMGRYKFYFVEPR